MSELSKQALKVENNMEFPNNNSGLITPSKLRTFNEDMIDSTVNQATYTSDSASWNAGLTLNAEKWVNISAQSASWDTGGDISSLNAFTASQIAKDSTLATYTASVDVSLSNINQFTASQITKDATLSTYTASVDQKFTNIGSQSGSWITESETGSFARYDVSNPWSADQTFTNITAVSASFTYVKTIFETASVIYSSGSNQFGDAADDTQTLYGAVKVMNELTASGLNYPTVDNGAKSFMQTDGNGNLSLQYVDAMYEIIRNMSGILLAKGTPVYISGSTGDNGNAYLADASDASKMPAMYIVGEDLGVGATGIALVGGLIEGVNTTGYPAGTIIYVAEGGGWTSTRPTSANSIVQVLGVVQKEGVGGQGVVINQLEAILPNIQTGYLWVGDGTNQPIAVSTSSIITNVNTGSFATTGSNNFVGNQTITGSLTISSSAAIDLTITGAVAMTGNLTTSGSNGQLQLGNVQLTITANAQSSSAAIGRNVIRQTSGSNAMGMSANPNQGSWVIGVTDPSILSFSGSYGVGNYYAPIRFQPGDQYTDGRVTFKTPIIAEQSLIITGSAPTILSSSFSGSLITNLTDIYNDVPAVKQIVTLTSASYAALVTSSLVDPNTLYVVSGSVSGGGTTIDTGSFATTGSNTFIGNEQVVGVVQASDANVGAQWFAPTVFQGVGTSAVAYDQFVNGGNYDAIHIESNLNAGTKFQDYNGSALNTWLQIPTNTGSNPKPILTRGLEVTGSTNIQNLTASLQQGYALVGNASGKTEAVPTSSFGGGAAFPYNGDAIISGSLQVTGSFRGLVNQLSVASSTASIDMNKGNFFTLAIPTSTTTHINVTNIKAGQTINLQLTQDASATGSISFPSNIKFAGGFDYTATAITGAVDLMSFVTFDTTNIIATAVKNLL